MAFFDFELLVRRTASDWSYTDRKRLVLFPEAYAVDHPGTPKRRAEFSAANCAGAPPPI